MRNKEVEHILNPNVDEQMVITEQNLKTVQDYIEKLEKEVEQSHEKVDESYLMDWFITSVNPKDKPIWTKDHIDELCNNFDIFIKSESKVYGDEDAIWEKVKNGGKITLNDF